MENTDEIIENVRVSDAQYRSLFESSRDGILILDSETKKIIDVNSSLLELLGGTREDYPGKELFEIGLFNDKDESRSEFQELIENGNLHDKIPLKTKGDLFIKVEVICNVFSEGSRRLIQCNIRETANHKGSESQKVLTGKNSLMLAQLAGKVAQLGGWYIELPERTLTWSDENCAIHEVPPGYQPTLEEGIGYYPEEYRDEVKRYVNECAQNGTPYDFELPKYTAKGRLIWVRSIGEPILDENGKIIGLQGAFQDITFRKNIEAEREKLIKELQKAFAEVKTLQKFLPICSYCRKIRDDQNYWSQIENYISENTHTKFSHGICPECYKTEVTPQIDLLKQRNQSNYQASHSEE